LCPYPINGSRTTFGAEPIEVQAIGLQNSRYGLEMDYDTIAVNMKFPQDRVASFVVGYTTVLTTLYRIVGTKGIHFSFGSKEFEFYFQVKLLSIQHRILIKLFHIQHDLVKLMKKEKRKPNGEEGLMDVRVVVYAIKQSLETEKPVKLEPHDRLKRAQMDQIRSVSFEKPPEQKDVIGRDSKKPDADATPDIR
jgi:glucose-fructose oxidoreductase